jgi:hypothetical protein
LESVAEFFWVPVDKTAGILEELAPDLTVLTEGIADRASCPPAGLLQPLIPNIITDRGRRIVMSLNRFDTIIIQYTSVSPIPHNVMLLVKLEIVYKNVK